MHNFLLHCAAATTTATATTAPKNKDACISCKFNMLVLGCVLHFTWDGRILLHMFCVHVLSFIMLHLMENNSVSLWGFFYTLAILYIVATVTPLNV